MWSEAGAAHERELAVSQPDTRRRHGVYYTPPYVVHHIVGHAFKAWFIAQADLPRILDPACGAGAFLVEAFSRLLDWRAHQLGHPLPPQERLILLRHHIFGLDIDPVAVGLTRRALLAVAGLADDIDLSANIVCGDALLPTSFVITTPITFDIILGNPPYVSFYARESRKPTIQRQQALTAQYGSLVGGRHNLFLFFLALALQRRSPNGVIAMLVPDTIGVNHSYRRTRHALEAAGLYRVDWLDFPVFADATVRTLVLVAGLNAGPSAFRTFATPEQLEADRPQTEISLAQSAVLARAGQVWPRRSAADILPLYDRDWANAVPLVHLADVRDGVNPGPRYFRERILNPSGPPRATWRPVIEGRHVTPYTVRPTVDALDYDPALITPDLRRRGASFRQPHIFQSPKLVSRQTAATLVFALDECNHIALNSVHCTRARDGERATLLYLLGLLNSRLLRALYRARFQETRAVFPQVHIAALRQLPILWSSPVASRTAIPALVEERVQATSPGDMAAIEQSLDEQVYRLYGLTDMDIAALEAAV